MVPCRTVPTEPRYPFLRTPPCLHCTPIELDRHAASVSDLSVNGPASDRRRSLAVLRIADRTDKGIHSAKRGLRRAR